VGEFFKPTRRKLGVMTLVIACVFAAGWMRSLFFIDGISFTSGKDTTESFVSAGGFASWQTKSDRETIQIKFSVGHDAPSQ